MSRLVEVFALPVSQTVKRKLLSSGYRTIADVEADSSHSLATAAKLEGSELAELLRVLHCEQHKPLVGSALLLEEQAEGRKIRTFCDELDELLGGGVALGHTTEFCGGPGIGKTQLGMQLCVNAAFPAPSGGIDVESMYLDTEGSFTPERIREICQGTINLISTHQQSTYSDPSSSGLSAESVLSRVHYFRLNSCVQQLALLEMLPTFLDKERNIRLIVFDSVSVHFRQGFEDMSHRTRILNEMGQKLMALAESRSIAVVFMNQVTKRFYGNNESETVPVLGESWSQCASTQVRLYWNDSVRYAGVYKSPFLEQKAVPYEITHDGVRSKTQQMS